MLFEVVVEVEIGIGIEAVIGVAIGIFATSWEEVGVVESCVEGRWSHP